MQCIILMAALRFTCISCWCFLLVCHEVVSGCTSGFMNLDLLRRRAVKIPEGGRTNTILDDEFRLIPAMEFTCSGTITSLLIGATYRTGGGRNEFPEVQVWRPSNPEGTAYTRQGSTQIILAAGDFSPDGVHRYDLINPIPFQSGDVLGVYQPEEGDSAVTLFYNIDTNAPDTRVLSSRPTTSVSLSSFSISSGQQILITPVSDSPSCTGNFLSTSELRQRVLQTNFNAVRRRENQQRLFPQIYFTCNGSVTKLIAGVEVGSSDMPRAELQIWRKDPSDTTGTVFNNINSTRLRRTAASIMDNVIELNLESPIEFREGDILGVFNPQRGGAALIFAYQERDGPENYRVDSPSSSTVSINGALSNQYDYPLVSVEISTASTSVAIAASTTVFAPSVSVRATEAEIPLVVVNTLAPPSSSSSSPSPSSDPVNSTAGNNIPIIAGAVVAFVLVLIIGAIVLALTIYCAYRRSGRKEAKSSQRKIPKQETGTFDNPIYGDEKSIQSLCSSSEHLHQNGVEQHYSVPVIHASTMPYSEISHYELPQHDYDALRTTEQSADNIPSHYSTYQWGIVVPTLKQRARLKSVPKNPSDDVYASLASVSTEPHQAQQMKFFEETTVFCEPGSDCDSIYEHMAKMKFREIIRQQISLTSFLGSGQFGNVSKGVWNPPQQPLDVAIKTLKDGASEKERVMFLQEAAVMGQFHHPNIVKLHGVVTMGEPVMIVLELMKYGDLKQYLTTLRPVPGELAPSSLPKQLLGYCRQIASGMEYLSRKSFVHRDLAARNILVDDGMTCKIADFGMSRDLHNENYYVSSGGQVPVKWTAPEALHYKKYSTASDVWSFGVLMYEIWSLGHKPFIGKTNPEALRMLHDGYRLPPPPGATRAIYHMMIQCWHPETSGRPTFANLVSKLSQSDNQLLKWKDERKTHPQSTMLGAPLETASDLHYDLQKTYSS